MRDVQPITFSMPIKLARKLKLDAAAGGLVHSNRHRGGHSALPRRNPDERQAMFDRFDAFLRT